jgi:hypothetical protein
MAEISAAVTGVTAAEETMHRCGSNAPSLKGVAHSRSAAHVRQWGSCGSLAADACPDERPSSKL